MIAGYRLPPPPGCSQDLYRLMIDCWYLVLFTCSPLIGHNVYTATHRNPVPACRPTFKDILTLLIGDEEDLLAIPYKDASTDSDAVCLGAPLKAGQKMYFSLQTKYLEAKPLATVKGEETIES